MKRLDKIKIIIVTVSIFIVVLIGILFFAVKGPISPSASISWGITFSKIQAIRLGLDWQKVYIETLDDLQPARIRIPIYWNDVELERGKYDFSSYSWMVDGASVRNIDTVLVIGRRTPRWPECHDPSWLNSLASKEQEEVLLAYIEAFVVGFKGYPNVIEWQVENEPFVEFFGECPILDETLLRKEVDLVRSLDSSRQIIMTDSGEYGYWHRPARYADILGTTMYRRVPSWPVFGEYNRYFFVPQFYRWKANLISKFVPIKKLIVAELQGEPWVIGTSTATDRPFEEQYRTMNPKYFIEIIEYARASGIGEIYWWGVEWWYWLKLQGHPEIWETAKALFSGNF